MAQSSRATIGVVVWKVVLKTPRLWNETRLMEWNWWGCGLPIEIVLQTGLTWDGGSSAWEFLKSGNQD